MTKEFIEYLMRLLEEKEVNVVTQRRHSYVMYQGIESDYVYILKEGVAKISNIMRDGREFNIAYVTEPTGRFVASSALSTITVLTPKNGGRTSPSTQISVHITTKCTINFNTFDIGNLPLSYL